MELIGYQIESHSVVLGSIIGDLDKFIYDILLAYASKYCSIVLLGWVID